MFGVIDWFRRRRALREPFPEAWREILRADVPFYPRLQGAALQRFEDKLKVFARTKHFIPAGGMEIDDRVRVVIAAAAARLVMNLPNEHFGRLTEIIVYPSAYKHAEQDKVVLGEAHGWGTVVLAWDAVAQGLANSVDGHDTATHEFAHVLDVADGAFDGTPVLESHAAYAPWVAVMTREFGKMRSRRGLARKGVMRKYGATNEAEFFAVATETFFEKPRAMKARHPELYERLCDHYEIDPLRELEEQPPAADGD